MNHRLRLLSPLCSQLAASSCAAADNSAPSDRLSRVLETGRLRVCFWPDYYGISYRNQRMLANSDWAATGSSSIRRWRGKGRRVRADAAGVGVRAACALEDLVGSPRRLDKRQEITIAVLVKRPENDVPSFAAYCSFG